MLQRSLLFSLGGYVIVSPTEENFDWTSIGAVNEVGNQKNCASCYAFAASDAIEAQIFLRTNELFELSNQQLVDCSKNYGNFGCNYGNTANTFKYIIDNGITIERNYKYKAKELKSCLYDSSTKVANISDYRQVRLPTDDFLRDILYSVGPLTVGIDSSLFSFQHYKFGIYKDENCSENINHAVLLVGFGVDETHGKYWIIKNSYGKNFGEKGFMRLTREIENFCGIRNYVVFPVNDISINYLIT
ncbi:CLUMA_CG020956, isoform A [Clunio marinus]|uniref:CLUMA_CG020956, isoform A n=1 Tax=Clunio marinus TaxID=568069 RepID=A0A1J1J792_9DIPT|nr:CLUMA_CG020956, isoform A [Clunio marinus]